MGGKLKRTVCFWGGGVECGCCEVSWMNEWAENYLCWLMDKNVERRLARVTGKDRRCMQEYG